MVIKGREIEPVTPCSSVKERNREKFEKLETANKQDMRDEFAKMLEHEMNLLPYQKSIIYNLLRSTDEGPIHNCPYRLDNVIRDSKGFQSNMTYADEFLPALFCYEIDVIISALITLENIIIPMRNDFSDIYTRYKTSLNTSDVSVIKVVMRSDLMLCSMMMESFHDVGYMKFPNRCIINYQKSSKKYYVKIDTHIQDIYTISIDDARVWKKIAIYQKWIYNLYRYNFAVWFILTGAILPWGTCGTTIIGIRNDHQLMMDGICYHVKDHLAPRK